jgi:hypothetical protein
MQKITLNPNTHYLDYYSDWSIALINANTYLAMNKVHIMATAFIGIINELLDAKNISIELHTSYSTEVNEMTTNKLNTFLN